MGYDLGRSMTVTRHLDGVRLGYIYNCYSEGWRHRDLTIEQTWIENHNTRYYCDVQTECTLRLDIKLQKLAAKKAIIASGRYEVVDIVWEEIEPWDIFGIEGYIIILSQNASLRKNTKAC